MPRLDGAVKPCYFKPGQPGARTLGPIDPGVDLTANNVPAWRCGCGIKAATQGGDVAADGHALADGAAGRLQHRHLHAVEARHLDGDNSVNAAELLTKVTAVGWHPSMSHGAATGAHTSELRSEDATQRSFASNQVLQNRPQWSSVLFGSVPARKCIWRRSRKLNKRDQWDSNDMRSAIAHLPPLI